MPAPACARWATLLGQGPFKGTILLTHLHWDHVQGLPFFDAGDRDDARATLVIPEQENGQSATAVLGRAMSPPLFPMMPEELRGSWSFDTIAPGERSFEGLEVLAREIPHKGGRTFGYRVTDGHTTLAYMPDHCPTALGAGPDGWGEYHAAALELASGVDLLIHDAQIFPGELAQDARFGHAVVDYAVELGRRAGAAARAAVPPPSGPHGRGARRDGAAAVRARRREPRRTGHGDRPLGRPRGGAVGLRKARG